MDKQPIKVAQVIGMAIDGGVEACIMNYYNNIDHSKVQFDFFVESTSKIINKEKIEAMGGKVIFIPSYKKIFKYMRVLKKLFKDGNYDIVHSNMNVLSVFTLRAAKKAGINVRIAHSHSSSNKKDVIKNIIKNVLKHFSRKYATDYFACSELAGRWLFGNKTFNLGLVKIINNAIDLQKFKFDSHVRDSIRKELDIENKFVIGHVGRFVAQKNQSFLLDIFYEFQINNPDSILLILGNGPLNEELIEKSKRLKIYCKVIFSGVHKHPERYYQAMDCFLLPSLYEGLPVSGIEAQINGLDCYFSNTITKELKVNENVQFISIEEKPVIWANKIKKEFYERVNGTEKFIKSRYDITGEAVKLECYYYAMVSERNNK